MRRRLLLLIAVGLGTAASYAFAADELMQTAREHFRPIPAEPLQLSGNPIP